MTEADECADMVFQRHMDIYPIDQKMASALAYVYFSHETDQVQDNIADSLLTLNARVEEELNQRFRNKAEDQYANEGCQINGDAKVSQSEDRNGGAWVATWVRVDLRRPAMTDKPDSLIYGQLNEATFADFLSRLRYDVKGPRTQDHYTADAIFLVQHEEKLYGIDRDYCDVDQMVVWCDDSKWFSPMDYWNDLDHEEKAGINHLSQKKHDCKFRRLDTLEQWDLLSGLPDHTVTGYQKQWVTLNTHLTYDAAQAFITRKAHDYGPLRVYADSAYWCWELKKLREALLSGELVYQPKEQSDAT